MKPDLERLLLAREVFDTVYENIETFRDNNLGANLCYLLGAIMGSHTCPSDPEFVDWSPEHSDCDPTLKIFRELFKPDHPVWDYIVTEAQ